MNLQPGSAEHRNASVARLRHAVQRLALEPAEQVAQFPVGVAVADELALDLDRGETLRILVVDDPFVDAVTGDGAFLLRASAPRDCARTVTQRVRRCLDYQVRDAKRGEVYLRLDPEQAPPKFRSGIAVARVAGAPCSCVRIGLAERVPPRMRV